jgi:hypothetical protein
MSSATSSFAQKAPRTKYLLVVESKEKEGFGYDAAVTLPSSLVIPQTLFTKTDFDALGSQGGDGYSLVQSQLYKDLGRELVVYYDDVIGSPHRNVYRECQLVNGPTTEGVDATPLDSRVFIKVFSARGRGIYVARTG